MSRARGNKVIEGIEYKSWMLEHEDFKKIHQHNVLLNDTKYEKEKSGSYLTAMMSEEFLFNHLKSKKGVEYVSRALNPNDVLSTDKNINEDMLYKYDIAIIKDGKTIFIDVKSNYSDSNKNSSAIPILYNVNAGRKRVSIADYYIYPDRELRGIDLDKPYSIKCLVFKGEYINDMIDKNEGKNKIVLDINKSKAFYCSNKKVVPDVEYCYDDIINYDNIIIKALREEKKVNIKDCKKLLRSKIQNDYLGGVSFNFHYSYLAPIQIKSTHNNHKTFIIHPKTDFNHVRKVFKDKASKEILDVLEIVHDGRNRTLRALEEIKKVTDIGSTKTQLSNIRESSGYDEYMCDITSIKENLMDFKGRSVLFIYFGKKSFKWTIITISDKGKIIETIEGEGEEI